MPLVLEWADAFRRRRGEWPRGSSGTIAEQPALTWRLVNSALRHGLRGLPGRSSLTQELQRHGRFARPPLTVEMILGWADAFYRRHGIWPRIRSGQHSPNRPGTQWRGINSFLHRGSRGLPGGSSLGGLALKQHPGKFIAAAKTASPKTRSSVGRKKPFSNAPGKWPQAASGLVPESGGTKWNDVNKALIFGFRGLPGGSCLKKLLGARKVMGPEPQERRPRLTLDQIWRWVPGLSSGTRRLADECFRTDRRNRPRDLECG